mmetsp:Transcript_28408/g.43506  ORF Transcript_28408/g.43506 Transcript_28408/m.43506 type:complete len:594 (+) Transcript_28408:178-1959(+)
MLASKDLNRQPVRSISVPNRYRKHKSVDVEDRNPRSSPYDEVENMVYKEKVAEHPESPVNRPRARNLEGKHRTHVQIMSRTLLQAITDDQRNMAFSQAQQMLDHKIETLHDIEISEGIVSSLCLQLGYVLNKGNSYVQDIVTIFSLLSLVYQCSDKSKAKSFQQAGEDLFRMIEIAFDNIRDTEYFDWCTYHIMRVVRALSRVKEASIAMVRQEEMLNIIRIIILDTDSNLGAKLDAVATLKNITYYAEDHRLKILHHPGLIDALIRTCTVHGDEMGKEFASAVIRNLAMAQNTKIPMVEHSCLLDVLVELTDDPDLKTRRNAISAIGSLAIADENSIAFVTHGEGIILQIMRRLVEEEEDAIIRRRAARALRCFGRKETVEMIVDCKDIVNSLCKVAMQDKSIEAQIEAIEALACYISHAHEMTSYYKKMLDAMVNIANSSPPLSCLVTLVKTMNTLSCFDRHQKPMTDHPELLQTVCQIAKKSKATVTCLEQAASVFYNLSCDEESREKITTPQILEVLVSIGSKDDADAILANAFAVRTLVNLAKFEDNRIVMAQENGLLKCLIQFASTSQDSTTKDEVKATIITLIPSL